MGLEALSRGAVQAVLVESSPAAIRVIRANIAALGLPGALLVADRVEKVLARGPAALASHADSMSRLATGRSQEGFGFVFADPPYAMEDRQVTAMLAALRERGWLAEGALLAVERGTRGAPIAWPGGYVADRARRYGDATLWYGHAAGL